MEKRVENLIKNGLVRSGSFNHQCKGAMADADNTRVIRLEANPTAWLHVSDYKNNGMNVCYIDVVKNTRMLFNVEYEVLEDIGYAFCGPLSFYYGLNHTYKTRGARKIRIMARKMIEEALAHKYGGRTFKVRDRSHFAKTRARVVRELCAAASALPLHHSIVACHVAKFMRPVWLDCGLKLLKDSVC